MAKSPAHKFGQIIGNLVEKGVESNLREIANEHNLYLDKKQERAARNGKKTVRWVDHLGNAHDLDYVLEEDGSDEEYGMPIAFIESAWRRYTKHARNKAQEIQGAVNPLVHTYWRNAPFAGAIIAGGFTPGSIEQLKAQGFEVLHFSQSDVVEAFATVGIDGHFGEDTPEDEFREKVQKWKNLDEPDKLSVASSLLEANQDNFNEFLSKLERKIQRRIEAVLITALYGSTETLGSITTAINYLEQYDESTDGGELKKYELSIRYNNGDTIDAQFENRDDAVEFLESYQHPSLTPVRYEEGDPEPKNTQPSLFSG